LLLPGTSVPDQLPIAMPTAQGESAETSGWPDWSALDLPIDPAAGSEDPELLALLGSLLPVSPSQTGDPQTPPSGLPDIALWTAAPQPMPFPQTVPTDTTTDLAEAAPILPGTPWMPAPSGATPPTVSPAPISATPSPDLPTTSTAPAGPTASTGQPSGPTMIAPSPSDFAPPIRAGQAGIEAETRITSVSTAPATPDLAPPDLATPDPAARTAVLATPSLAPQTHPEAVTSGGIAAPVPPPGMAIVPPPMRQGKTEALSQTTATDALGMTAETIAVAASDAPAVSPGMHAQPLPTTSHVTPAPAPAATAVVAAAEPATGPALPVHQMAAITPRAGEATRREAHAPTSAEPVPAGTSGSEGSTPTAQPSATFSLRSEPVSLPRSEPVVRSEPNPVERAVAHQVSRAIIQHLPDGGARMVMRLTPPELGTVRVEFLMRDGVVTARLLAEDDGVRQALDRALPQLRNEVRSEHPTVDITVDRSDQRQSWQDGNPRHEQRHDPQGGNDRRPRDGDERFSLDLESPPIEAAVRRVDQALGGRVSARAVDAFA
jgi:flagellar hook-length control protein FliK